MNNIKFLLTIFTVALFFACGSKSKDQAYYDGDEFTAQTEEGVEMRFKVISAENKTVQVGNGDSNQHPQLSELAAIDQNYEGKVTIPQEINDYHVIRIAKCAFFKCKVSKIQIEEGVEIIKEDAFFCCENLKEILLPQSLKTIEKSVFWGCSNLTVINIPQNVDYIGDNALAADNLEILTVDKRNKNFDSRGNCNAIISTSTNTLIRGCKNTRIPNGITTIGENAFSNISLNKIEIPISVKTIKENAYGSCNLSNIYIPENVEYISEKAFDDNCHINEITVSADNEYFDSRNNCNAIIDKRSQTLVKGCKSTIIPTDVKTIGAGAFRDCIDLKDIRIPMGVQTIMTSAFFHSGITFISIPSSVKEIGDGAFYLTKLKKIELADGLEIIGERAFSHTNIEQLHIPATVRLMGKGVTKFCPYLRKIAVAPENKRFDSRNNCNAIINTNTRSLRAGCMNTIIPNDVLKIEEDAMYFVGLSRIIIPEGIREIEEDALGGNVGLVVTSLIKEPFEALLSNIEFDTLYVPKGTKEKYASTKGWKKAKNIVELSE